MTKEEKELKAKVDEYFEKHWSVSFDKFLENWEEMEGWLKHYEKENGILKHRLNDIVFSDVNDDVELGARYLRKIGYIGFDEERKVYLNKHNKEPFWEEDEKEKNYYIQDEELDEYTKQLEYKLKQKENIIKEVREYIESIEKVDCRYFNYNRALKEMLISYEDLKKKVEEDGTLEGHFIEINKLKLLEILKGSDK